MSFNTQPPEGGWVHAFEGDRPESTVSTHSRLKAAGYWMIQAVPEICGFNTQPPEGGWPETHPIKTSKF